MPCLTSVDASRTLSRGPSGGRRDQGAVADFSIQQVSSKAYWSERTAASAGRQPNTDVQTVKFRSWRAYTYTQMHTPTKDMKSFPFFLCLSLHRQYIDQQRSADNYFAPAIGQGLRWKKNLTDSLILPNTLQRSYCVCFTDDMIREVELFVESHR